MKGPCPRMSRFFLWFPSLSGTPFQWCSSVGIARHDGRKRRPGIMRTYFQVPPVMAKPFAHCRYADSSSYVAAMFSGAGVIRQTLTTIFNLQDKLSFLFVQTDGCGIAAGVTPVVCQSFLNHAEQIHLSSGGKRPISFLMSRVTSIP